MQTTTSTTPATPASPEPATATEPKAPAESVWARARRTGAAMRLARVGALFGVAGVAVALTRGSTPGNDVRALAAALGEVTHTTVSPEDLRWEGSRGALMDAMRGRWVLFLGVAAEDGTHDVWRAKVRLSPEGHPIGVVEAHNLTSTPLGDDGSLVLRGHYAAFATTAFGGVQSVTLLDLDGEGEQNKAEKLSDKLMSFVTNYQRTGSGPGLARFDVTFDKAPRAVGLALSDTTLALDIADEASVRHASVDLAKGDLVRAPPGMRAEAAMHLPKRFSHWAVDTVRAISWIGPAPIAWLEENVFALKDDAKRFFHKLAGSGGSTEQLATAGAKDAPSVVLDTSEASVEAAHWPPAKIPTIWKETEPGEGEWSAPKPTWIRKVPGTDAAAPPPMMVTFVRPDDERSYAKVFLVAMDMRQLDVDMEAGSEDPQPMTGPTGPGKLPRDPAIYQRVVACFNGAFKTEHGHYGMMVHKRVLLPPQPGAATVITTKDNRIGLGSWGTNKTVSGLKGIADDDIVSFRQNLDALVDHGEVNPSGRSLWGFSAPGKGIQTERSGICATSSGHLVYAWGDDVSATTLAKGMKMAGCDYGMHLDMNPYHTGFLFTNIDNIKTKSWKAELLDKGMEIPKERFIEWAPKDFFYVMVHDPTPAALEGASGWQPDPGTQPAPAWMPGLWASKVEVDGGQVELFDVEAGRATWRVRAGAKEAPGAPATLLRELTGEDAKRVLLAVGVGFAPDKRAIATDGALAIPLKGGDGWAVLVAGADGRLAIQKTGDATPGADLIELPLILDEGSVARAAAGQAVARAALGLTADGRVLIARGTFASDAPLAEALKRAGCARAVALERGSRSPPFVHRAGQPSAPRSRYEDSVIYAIASPLKPRAFRFEAEAPLAPTNRK